MKQTNTQDLLTTTQQRPFAGLLDILSDMEDVITASHDYKHAAVTQLRHRVLHDDDLRGSVVAYGCILLLLYVYCCCVCCCCVCIVF